MAEFCHDCTPAIPHGNPRNNDFRPGIFDKPFWSNKATRIVLCEGCGWIEINAHGRRLQPWPPLDPQSPLPPTPPTAAPSKNSAPK